MAAQRRSRGFSTKSSLNACFAMQQGYAPPACALIRHPGEGRDALFNVSGADW